jgi:uncharacterized damage-inducible protein DinB
MKFVCAMLLAVVAAWAADGSGSTIRTVLEGQLKMTEREVVSLAEAMPADKYSFAPTQGEFQGVRTFAQQVSHLAAVMNMTAAAVLGESIPNPGKSENGPASLHTKDQVVEYLKGAFAHAHKAMASLTDQNATELVKSAFGKSQVPRLNMASIPIWHTFDHYGQMVVYARMNGIVPPASRR